MFDKLKTDVKKIGLDIIRADESGYFEAVIKKESLGALTGLLESVLGSPAFPSRNKLPQGAEKLVRSLGGVRSGQTLYFLNNDGISIFAMLWPWQDGERITLKMGKDGK